MQMYRFEYSDAYEGNAYEDKFYTKAINLQLKILTVNQIVQLSNRKFNFPHKNTNLQQTKSFQSTKKDSSPTWRNYWL